MTPSAPTKIDLAVELEQRIAMLWWTLTHEMARDLSRTAASVLGALKEEGPQRVTTLAAREFVAQPSMSVLVQRLAKRGFVARQDDPDDKRACRIAITPAGEQALQDRADVRSQWLGERLAELDEAQRAALLAALEPLDALIGKDAE